MEWTDPPELELEIAVNHWESTGYGCWELNPGSRRTISALNHH